MPNHKSAKKRVLVNAKKTARNKSIRSSLRTTIKKADAVLQSDTGDKNAALKLAIKKIDQAVSKGILHKNTAARKKSQLAVKCNRAG